MKPRTVYEKAVQDFTETASKAKPTLSAGIVAEFEMLMELDDEALSADKL